jgi:hypothetical protein
MAGGLERVVSSENHLMSAMGVEPMTHRSLGSRTAKCGRCLVNTSRSDGVLGARETASRAPSKVPKFLLGINEPNAIGFTLTGVAA